VAVFQYKAVDKQREDHRESGTVLAQNEDEARRKLQRLNLEVVRMKRMTGLAGFLKSFTADVR
jgi:type II secretory pathway component PulF